MNIWIVLTNGMNADYKDIDINSLVSTWLYEIKMKDTNFKPASFSRYEGIYRNYIKDSEIGFLRAFMCKTINIQRYYNKLSEKGKSESQINNLNKVLKGAFEYAVQEGYAQKNPCQYITIPKTEKSNFDETEDLDFDFFEYDELLKIIHECQKRISNNDSDYFPYLVLFSLSSGLRLGEATGLQRKYFHDYVVNVRKELAKIKIFKDNKFDRYEYKLIPVKTKSSVRDVTMPTLFFDEIDRYINTVLKDIYKSNNVIFNENSLIFINSECGFIDQSNLRKKWIKLLNDLNIKYRKWHRLRAGFACLLFKEGVDIKTVQELLGHKDINTTINIYLKVFPESKKESVNNLNNLLLHETKVINM